MPTKNSVEIFKKFVPRQGLFTRKIDRPSEMTCLAFAAGSGEEALTGDSDGNVMIWKGNKVNPILLG